VWAQTNIGEEIFKRVPSWVNLYPATAIVLIFFNVLVFASGVHASPSSIFRAYFSVFSMTVRGIDAFTGASTGNDLASSKLDGCNDVVVPTIALTEPSYVAVSILADWSNYNQSSKSDICDRQWSCGHRTGSIGSGSSDGIDVSASIPLRTLAWAY
jgi:hypothetical protein